MDGQICWLESPIAAFKYTSTGSPLPGFIDVVCKISVGDIVNECNTLWLVSRKSNDGNTWVQHVSAVQSNSINIPAPTGYSLVLIRAYKSLIDANNWTDNYVCEKGIGTVSNGSDGEVGATGAMPRDRGVFATGTEYVWNSDYRDKIIYMFDNVYYNFLVKNYGNTVTEAPTSKTGDDNWEPMDKHISIATDTLFVDGANVANFMFKDGVMKSQQMTDGVANMIMNGKTGYFHCNNVDIKGNIVADSGIFNGIVNADGGVFQNITIKRNINTPNDNFHIDENGFVTMTGKIFQIDSVTQEPVPIPVDKMEWLEGESYAFYDRVSYKGALWLCVNPDGTNSEPNILNPDWLKQVSEGKDGELLGNVSKWDHTKTPYTKGKVVSFRNSLYIALVDTSNPPIAIAKYNNGAYIRKKDGGYILAGKSSDKLTHSDWELVLDGNQLKGENTITADIDNEMVGCPLSSEGKTLQNHTWELNVKMWNGYEPLSLSSIVVSTISGFTVSSNVNTGKITISVNNNTYISEINKFDIIVKSTKNNYEFVRNLSFTVSGVKSGANGEDAVVYSLVPSVSVIQVDKEGNITPTLISCTRYKTIGSKREITTDGELKYNIDGNGEILIDNGVNIDVNYINKNIKFIFYIDGKVVDIDSIPKLSDGTDGKNGDSLTPSGRWESSKTPYAKGSVVLFAGGSFVALIDTSNPPIAIAKYNNGNYIRKSNGDYILAGKSSDYEVHPDWQTIVAPIKPSAIYWLESPITAFRYTSTGSPYPGSVQVSCKMSVADYTGSCNMLWLVARKSNDGSGWIQHVVATQAQSINISAPTGYTQVLVRAYKSLSDANNWNEEFVCEKGIGVVTDGATGATGATGAMPRDRGVFANGTTYEWNSDYRDKVIHLINGVYYNFLVKNYGSRVTSAPSSIYGDSNWEVMNKYISIATDTLFADGANVAGFMFKNGVMRSQQETGGVANMILNGQTGYFHCNNVDIKGKIIADSGVFNGTVNADGGVFQNITIKKNINTANDNFYIDGQGNVSVKGKITATSGTFNNVNITGTLKTPWRKLEYEVIYSTAEVDVWGFNGSGKYDDKLIVSTIFPSAELLIAWGDNAEGREMIIYVKGQSVEIKPPAGKKIIYGNTVYDSNNSMKLSSSSIYRFYGFADFWVVKLEATSTYL